MITIQLKRNIILEWLLYAGLSFGSAFVFGMNLLILYGFRLTSFHLAEAKLFPKAILKSQKTSFSSSFYSEKAKRCSGIKVELRPHYLLFCGFSPKMSSNVFLKKLFLVLILQLTYFICITWKRKQTMEQQPHRACEWTKSNKNKKKLRHVIFKSTTRSTVQFSP